MRDKDKNNTFVRKPKNVSEHYENSTGAYKKTEDDEIKIVNKDFIQISDRYISQFCGLMIENPNAASIFGLMMKYMESNNTYIVSSSKLANAIRMSVSTAKRSLKFLVEINFIYPYLRLKNNAGTCYFINPHIVCKVSANYKQFLIRKYDKLLQNNVIKTLDNIDEEALISENRLILRSDEKAQLDKLKRPDNVKTKVINDVVCRLDDITHMEASSLSYILDNDITFTDLLTSFGIDKYDVLENGECDIFSRKIDKLNTKKNIKTLEDNIKTNLLCKEALIQLKEKQKIQEEQEELEEPTQSDYDEFGWFERVVDIDELSDEQLYGLI